MAPARRVRRREMERAGGAFRGLWLDVDGPEVPVVRVEVAPPRLLRIVQGVETVLLGWVEPGHWGAEVIRTGGFAPPVPPLRADDARRRSEASSDAADWLARWCHVFADALAASDRSPLHTGSWTLRPARVWGPIASGGAAAASGVDPSGVGLDPDLLPEAAAHVDWGAAGAGELVPLRPLDPLDPPDAGRVKAHRKRARDGTLPPVLVWWVGGLTAPVVLDGHDRLAAALAEEVAPPVVELASVRAPGDDRPGDDGPRAVDALLRLAADGDTGSDHARALAVAVAHEQLAAEERVRTVAWPLPGGEAAWVADAALLAPSWLADLRSSLDDDPVEQARLGDRPTGGA